MSDQEGWLELCDLYLLHHEFGRAAFCMEELLLNSPHNHLYHQRYAEIKYTQGGFDNMEIAKAHFCQAAKLNPNNLRALYGVCQVFIKTISPHNIVLKNKKIYFLGGKQFGTDSQAAKQEERIWKASLVGFQAYSGQVKF